MTRFALAIALLLLPAASSMAQSADGPIRLAPQTDPDVLATPQAATLPPLPGKSGPVMTLPPLAGRSGLVTTRQDLAAYRVTLQAVQLGAAGCCAPALAEVYAPGELTAPAGYRKVKFKSKLKFRR